MDASSGEPPTGDTGHIWRDGRDAVRSQRQPSHLLFGHWTVDRGAGEWQGFGYTGVYERTDEQRGKRGGVGVCPLTLYKSSRHREPWSCFLPLPLP